MRGLVPKVLLVALSALLLFVAVTPASAAPTVNGRFELASELGTNNKITPGPDGNMWFTLEGADDVGEVTAAGLVLEFELPQIEMPIGIAAGPEGRLWVVATGKATSFLPSDPEGTEETFKSALINAEPNLVLGPDGDFWVASEEKVARFSPADFNDTIEEVPLAGKLSPKDIDVDGSLIVISDSDMTPVTELGRLVTFTTAGVQRDIEIPGPSQGLAGSSIGQIAFSAPGANPEQAGLVTPPTAASSFELLGDPFGVAYGGDAAFWIVQFQKGQLTRLAPNGQTSVLGGLPIESARQIAAGPNGTLWVTLAKKEGLVPVSAIARVTAVEPPPAPPQPAPPTTTPSSPPNVVTVTTKPVPQTIFGQGSRKAFKTAGSRAKVKIAFYATEPGATFECQLVKKPSGKGKARKKPPTPPFSACISPKVFHLGPGAYRFAARAVIAGFADPTPAETSFAVHRVVGHPRHR